jgi:hypothetical protein
VERIKEKERTERKIVNFLETKNRRRRRRRSYIIHAATSQV